MATIYTLSQPNENNVTINTLPLILWSTNRDQPQFKFVLDIYYANTTTRLNRVKFANNAQSDGGAATIDLAPLVRDYLTYDKPWYTTGSSFTQNINAARFTFVAGEEFATTTSGSVVIYNGTDGSVGEPAFTASQNNLWPIVNEYDEGSYNWDFNSYAGRPLTNYISQSITFGTPVTTKIEGGKVVYNGDYETLTYIDNVSGSQSIDFTSIEVAVYSGSTLIASDTNILNPDPSTQNNQNMLRYIGVGPQNLSDLSTTLANAFNTGSWTGYNVFTDVDIEDGLNDQSHSVWYKNGECTNYDRTRFTFINKYGTWDYFNVDLPLSKQTEIQRKNVTRTHLQSQNFYNQFFSGSAPVLTGGPVYDINSRGLDSYYIQPTDDFIITSNWLQENDANWLTEMIDSPDVYTQIGTTFQPINITTAKYNWKTNPRGQKLFEFKIEYQLSNKRTSR